MDARADRDLSALSACPMLTGGLMVAFASQMTWTALRPEGNDQLGIGFLLFVGPFTVDGPGGPVAALALGAFIVATGVCLLVTGQRGFALGGLAAATCAIGMAVYHLATVRDRVGEASSRSDIGQVLIGGGAWALLAGAITAIAGALLVLTGAREERAPRTAPPLEL